MRLGDPDHAPQQRPELDAEVACICGGTEFNTHVAKINAVRDDVFHSCANCGLMYAGAGPKTNLHKLIADLVGQFSGENRY